jgi:predicted nucleic acid-binding protein
LSDQVGSAEIQGDPAVTLLDACAVISLFATRWMGDIIDEIDGSVAVVDAVIAESLYVRRGGHGEDARELETIDLKPFIESGKLAPITVDDEGELHLFIDLVATLRLDDGEAMTAAVAISRNYVMVTDDGKAERRLYGRVALRSTLDVIKVWADRRALDAKTVASALIDVRERRSYVPPPRHPLKGWWDLHVGDR